MGVIDRGMGAWQLVPAAIIKHGLRAITSDLRRHPPSTVIQNVRDGRQWCLRVGKGRRANLCFILHFLTAACRNDQGNRPWGCPKDVQDMYSDTEIMGTVTVEQGCPAGCLLIPNRKAVAEVLLGTRNSRKCLVTKATHISFETSALGMSWLCCVLSLSSWLALSINPTVYNGKNNQTG